MHLSQQPPASAQERQQDIRPSQPPVAHTGLTQPAYRALHRIQRAQVLLAFRLGILQNPDVSTEPELKDCIYRWEEARFLPVQEEAMKALIQWGHERYILLLST